MCFHVFGQGADLHHWAIRYFEKLVDVVSDVQKKCTPPMPTLETVLEGKRVRYKQCLECQTKTKSRGECGTWYFFFRESFAGGKA